jgi:hypothetical protein
MRRVRLADESARAAAPHRPLTNSKTKNEKLNKTKEIYTCPPIIIHQPSINIPSRTRLLTPPRDSGSSMPLCDCAGR